MSGRNWSLKCGQVPKKANSWEGVELEHPVVSVCECYLSPEGIGLISCPFCGHGKVFDFKDRMPSNQTITVRCKCGNQFETFLEVRQYYRKRVKLLGQYTNMTSRRSGRMIVENISHKGFAFRVMGIQFFEKEDLVKVTFELDNSKNSQIVLKGAVRHFRGNFVGCRTLEIPEGQKELGFYLLS
jgi:hypothetical protein